MPPPSTEDLLDPRLPTVRTENGDLAAVLTGIDPAGLILALGHRVGDTRTLTGRLDDLGLSGSDIVAAHEPQATAGALCGIPLVPQAAPARHLALVGLGEGTGEQLRAAGAALGRHGRGRERVVLDLGSECADDAVAAFVEGFQLGAWAPPRWTGAGTVAGGDVPAELVLVGVSTPRPALEARSRCVAVVRARSLATTPSNIKNPAWLARQARTLAGRTGLSITVRQERQLRQEGFGGLLAVGGGSATPPRLVTLTWTPPEADSTTPHVVLVGKGITFDTGGLAIKPAEGMLTMKTDMSGAAVVLAVLSVCRELAVPVQVTGLLPLSENAVSGAAYRPGDVVVHYGGRTTEIGNTDAEGRIVLADALAHADLDLDPDWLVDVATLTGAARVALGRAAAPVYGTDPALVAALVDAGEASGETLWPMPLPASYRPFLDSDVADVKQVVEGGPGSVMAAMFLQQFIGTRRWAHLDIAGPGRSDVDAGILHKGATAFGTRLLLRWLEGLS